MSEQLLRYQIEQLQRQLVAMDAALGESQPEHLHARRYEDALRKMVELLSAHTATGRTANELRSLFWDLRSMAMGALGGALKHSPLFPGNLNRCDARHNGRRCQLLVGHGNPEGRDDWEPLHGDGEQKWRAKGYGREEAIRQAKEIPF